MLVAGIAKITYNCEDDGEIHRLAYHVGTAMEGVALGLVPGKYLVEFLPWLRYLPSWFLGPELRTRGPEWRKSVMYMKHVPFEQVKTLMVSPSRCSVCESST